ncbi:MAG: cytochrome d ubiquinol oxidase subunit II [Propionibacteriales bacterium]|nr:cytochrome d ubiquinol oxidase subunit II [Propionibacteriales bacterium]
MELTTVWFSLITVLWVGYFVLEGFDFGVGMLLPALTRSEVERRVLINTIGPVWDGNEVWLLVAGGATFAAFPDWYATLFSGFYLPLLLILLALIGRGVAFEYRHKRDDAAWRARWDAAIFVGSVVPAVLWGVAFANIVRGVAIDADKEFVGSTLDLLNPFGLVGGVTTTLLFLTHGAVFISLKTDGDIRHRARRLAVPLGLAAAVMAVVFMAWAQSLTGNPGSLALFGLAAVSLVAGLLAAYQGREGWAFTGTFVAIGVAVTGLFVALFPEVMPSTLDPAYSLTTTNAAATDYSLKVMTVVAIVFTPIVVLYEAWSYWVFRRRISTRHIPGAVTPSDPLSQQS